MRLLREDGLRELDSGCFTLTKLEGILAKREIKFNKECEVIVWDGPLEEDGVLKLTSDEDLRTAIMVLREKGAVLDMEVLLKGANYRGILYLNQ